MLRRLATDVAKHGTCRALQQSTAVNSASFVGLHNQLLVVINPAQPAFSSNHLFSTDFKVPSYNPRGIFSDEACSIAFRMYSRIQSSQSDGINASSIYDCRALGHNKMLHAHVSTILKLCASLMHHAGHQSIL
jgi:hypothetical protein